MEYRAISELSNLIFPYIGQFVIYGKYSYNISYKSQSLIEKWDLGGKCGFFRGSLEHIVKDVG